MAEQEQDRTGALQHLAAWVQNNHAQQPSLGAQLRSMGREGVKDVRDTMMQTFFGGPDRPGEPGTPLNPTPQLVTQDLGNAQGYEARRDEFAGNVHGSNDKERGHGR